MSDFHSCNCPHCYHGYSGAPSVTAQQMRMLWGMYRNGRLPKPPTEDMTWHEANVLLRKDVTREAR